MIGSRRATSGAVNNQYAPSSAETSSVTSKVEAPEMSKLSSYHLPSLFARTTASASAPIISPGETG